MAVDLPPHLSHALVVLASHYPNIFPSQDQLAAEMHTSRRNVNKRLHELEAAGLIRRMSGRTGRATRYRLQLECELQGTKPVIPSSHQEQEEESNVNGSQYEPLGF